MVNKMNRSMKRRSEKLVAQLGGKCSICGTKESLEFGDKEHIEPTDKGVRKKERIQDVIKHPSSYLLLCSKCHHDWDQEDYFEEDE